MPTCTARSTSPNHRASAETAPDRAPQSAGTCRTSAQALHASPARDPAHSVRLRAAERRRKCVATHVGEGVHSSCDDEAKQRERQRRLHEHRVLAALAEWHHVGRAERGRVGEAEGKVVEQDGAPPGRCRRGARVLREREVDGARPPLPARSHGTRTAASPGSAMLIAMKTRMATRGGQRDSRSASIGASPVAARSAWAASPSRGHERILPQPVAVGAPAGRPLATSSGCPTGRPPASCRPVVVRRGRTGQGVAIRGSPGAVLPTHARPRAGQRCVCSG